MSSTRGVLLGEQRPRVASHPRFAWSHADDAAFLSSAYGLAPYDWQFSILEAWLGVTKSGRWAAGRCGLAVPRQNGKNGLVEIVELFKMIALGRKILHTAHEVKTARKAFLRLAGFFENPRHWPELAALVKEIRKTNGQEAIVLDNGASCEFVARSRGSGRGYTVDDLVLDEAQELTDEQLEALLPTMSAAPSGDPQLVMIGTPPGPNSPGEVFTRMRETGVGGKDRRLCWDEWSAVGKRIDVADRALWAANNPSLGAGLHVTVVEDELAQMSPDGFARERLGVWASDQPGAARVFDADDWDELATKDPPTDGTVAYGVKFSPDGQTVAVGVALRPADGPVHVEAVHHRRVAEGTSWLVSWLSERAPDAGLIVVDGKSGAGALVQALRKAGVLQRRILVPTVEQVTSAHAMFLTAVTDKGLSHFAGDTVLTESIGSAGRRKIGNLGGWGLQPVDDGDVTVAESVVLAHFGALTAKRRRTGDRRRSERRAVVA